MSVRFASLLLAPVARRTAAAFAPQASALALRVADPLRVSSPPPRVAARFSRSASSSPAPVCIVVEVVIREGRMDEFLDVIERDAVGSRAEPGCIRFDVLQAEDSPNKFLFYEVYEDADAVAHHKEQPYYLAWGAFKESGGTVSSISRKASGKFMS